MSENSTFRSSRTMGRDAGTEESLMMDSVSVTQRFFLIEEGHEGKGSDAAVVTDAGGASSDLEPHTLDKIPRRRAPLYGFLALLSLLFVWVLFQDDIEQFFKQSLSIQGIGHTGLAVNPVVAPSENSNANLAEEVVMPPSVATSMDDPKPFVAINPVPNVPAVVVERTPPPSVPSIRSRSSKHAEAFPNQKAWVPTEPVPSEVEANDVSPFERNEESLKEIDTAPSKHSISDRAANPF